MKAIKNAWIPWKFYSIKFLEIWLIYQFSDECARSSKKFLNKMRALVALQKLLEKWPETVNEVLEQST